MYSTAVTAPLRVLREGANTDMAPVPLRWATRAHGERQIIISLARVVLGSRAINDYIGAGQQISERFLNNPDSDGDHVYYFFPMLRSGLTYSANVDEEDRVHCVFDVSAATWATLFPVQ